VSRPALEVADILRDHGPAWRHAMRGHLDHDQLKVMSAIESCRTADLGGHVARCEACGYTVNARWAGRAAGDKKRRLLSCSLG
jgi:Transposase zinc-binding domain